MKTPPPTDQASAQPEVRARRRRKAPVLSAEESIGRLRELYVHLAGGCGLTISTLARVSEVPFETLRHFLADQKHKLCGVNEEKLARALGHDGGFFRWLVGRYARFGDWKKKCVAASVGRLRLWLALMPALELQNTWPMEIFLGATAALSH